MLDEDAAPQVMLNCGTQVKSRKLPIERPKLYFLAVGTEAEYYGIREL